MIAGENKMIGKTPIEKGGKKKVPKKVAKKDSKKDGKKEEEVKEEKPVVDTKEKTGEEKIESPIEEKKTEEAIKVVQEVVAQNPTGISKLTLDKGKIELLKNTIAKGATNDELKMFINVCTGMGLSPFLKQVYMVKRWDSKLGKEIASIQVGIDGFRSIAENTGAYAGNDDPEMGEDIELKFKQGGKDLKMDVPSRATVTVRKIVQGVACKFASTARWTEFYPGDKMGFMWRKMPNVMLGKCAEAQALRKAFPKVLGGVYAPEEMDQAGTKKTKTAKDPIKVAEAMIKRAIDKKELFDFLDRIKKADVYTDEQKKHLEEVIRARSSELENDDQT